jgi:TPR repeat protein
MGSNEAQLRLLMIDKLSERRSGEAPKTLSMILASADSGSVLAQEILGYCHDRGYLVASNRPEAVRYYRMAAQRGSLAAYNALKELYNKIRPPGAEFRLPQE